MKMKMKMKTVKSHSHSHSHSHSNPPLNSLSPTQFDFSLPLSLHPSIHLSPKVNHPASLQPSPISPLPSINTPSPLPSNHFPHIQLPIHPDHNSSFISPKPSKPLMSNNTILLLDKLTSNFLQIVLSTDFRNRQILKRRGSLSDLESASWSSLSIIRNSSWPDTTFLVPAQDDDDYTALAFEKFNLAHFFVETIQNLQHISKPSVSWFVRSILIDRHSNKLKTLDQTTLNFVIQLEIQKLGIDLWKKKKNQPNRLFDRKGKTRKSFAQYIAILDGQSPSPSDSTALHVPDAISEDMFAQRCDQVSKDIASLNGNPTNYEIKFPLDHFISSCLDLIKKYPNSVTTTSNDHPTQASTSDIEDSLPDSDRDLNSTLVKSPDSSTDEASTDEEQDTPSFRVESLLHRPASPVHSNSPNSQPQSPTSGHESRNAQFKQRYHVTTASLSHHQGWLCKNLTNHLDRNPRLFDRHYTSAPLQPRSISTPVKLAEHQPHLGKSAEQLVRPNGAHHTTLSSPVKALSQSSLKVSARSDTKAGPSRPAFRWNQTQSDASQIEFDSLPSPDDEPAVDRSPPSETEQVIAQLDGASDHLSHHPRITPAQDGEEAEAEPGRMQGAANRSLGSLATELAPPSSSAAHPSIRQQSSRKTLSALALPSSSATQSPIPARKSGHTSAAQNINRNSARVALTGIEDVDELDMSPQPTVDRTTRPAEVTMELALQIHEPEPSPAPNSHDKETSSSSHNMLYKSSSPTTDKEKPTNVGQDGTVMTPAVRGEGHAGRSDRQLTETPALDRAVTAQENAAPTQCNAAPAEDNAAFAQDKVSRAHDNASKSPSRDSGSKSSNRKRHSLTIPKHGFLPLSSSDSEPESNLAGRSVRSPPLRGSGRFQGRAHQVMKEKQQPGDEDQNSKKRPRHEGESDASMPRTSENSKKRPRGGHEPSASKEVRQPKAAGSNGPRSDENGPNVPHAAWRTKPASLQKQGDDSSDLMNITSDPSTSDSESESLARTRMKRGSTRGGSRRFWTPAEEKLLIREVEKNYRHANCMAEILQRHGPQGYKSQTFAKRTSVMLKDKAVNLSTKWMREGIKLSAKQEKAFARFPPKGKFLDNHREQSSGREIRGERKDRSSRSLLPTKSKHQEATSSESEVETEQIKERTSRNSRSMTALSRRRIGLSEDESEDDGNDKSQEMAKLKRCGELAGRNSGDEPQVQDAQVMASSKRRTELSPINSDDIIYNKQRIKVVIGT